MLRQIKGKLLINMKSPIFLKLRHSKIMTKAFDKD